MVWTVPQFGPSDLLTSDREGVRRVKVESSIADKYGRSARVSMKGEVLTGSLVDDVDINYQYIIRTAVNSIVQTGTGVVSHAGAPGPVGAYAQLSPGTGIGKAEITSKAPVRYRAGHESYCEASWIFRTPETNLNQYAGFLNDNDRFCVGYRGLEFGVLFTEGGNESFYPLGSNSQYGTAIDNLDGNGPSGMVLNKQAINVYRLAFIWHGGLPLTLEINYKQQWWPVYTLDFSNSINETHLENPHLPVGGLVERTAGTGTDEVMRTASVRGGSIAGPVPDKESWTGYTVLDVPLVSSARTNLIALYNPPTWQGKVNHIVYELGVVTFRSTANKDVALYGTKGATLIGAGTATFIDETNYAIQYITGGTITGGTRGPGTLLGAGERDRIDVRGTGIKIYPGETLVNEADPGGSVNGTFSIAVRLIHEG